MALSVLHPAGDPFNVHFSYDKQWGLQVGYGDDGRLYVSSVSNNDLNDAKKKGILVGDIVTAINDQVFSYPAPTVHVFFDMVNKARSARQSISISFSGQIHLGATLLLSKKLDSQRIWTRYTQMTLTTYH